MGWTFDSVPFAVAAESGIMQEWFPATTAVDAKRILGADAWVVSIGASGYGGELQFTAQFASDVARDALLAKQNTVATLVDDVGRTCQALLKDTTTVRVIRPTSGVKRLTVTFVYVSP